MVADLGKEEGWAMREDGTRFKLGEASCIYYEGKRFEWKDHDGRRIFLEASSFFNRIPLKEAAKTLCICACDGCRKHGKEPKRYQHCGESEATCPMKDPVDASKMSLSKYESDKRYRETVDKYCAKDARLVYRLMEFLRKGFADLGTQMNGTPIDIGGTPGATARRLLRDMPPFPKVVWTTQKAFLETYCGGRFEITRRGVFHDAKQYDKVSAYPWALANCPMLSPAATHEFTRRLSDNALYGAYEVEFSTDDYFGLMPGWRGNTRVYSAREKRGWLCRPELEWLQRKGYDYKIHRGIEVFDESPTDGWRELVLPIFCAKDGHTWTCPTLVRADAECKCDPDERKKRKGQPLGLGAKVGVNSLYGILIQLILKGGIWKNIADLQEGENVTDFAGLLAYVGGPKAYDAGQFYAPVYSATLTSMVRVDLLDTATKAGQDDVVAFHTDSILLKENATLPEGGKLGDWKLEKEVKGDDALIILKSGQYALGESVKGRGFSKRKLNPADEDEIAVRQRVDLWANRHTRRGRVSVKTAKDWRDVSAIKEKQVANNIGWETKRDWAHDWSAARIQRMVSRKEWMDSTALRDTGKAA